MVEFASFEVARIFYKFERYSTDMNITGISWVKLKVMSVEKLKWRMLIAHRGEIFPIQ